MQTVSAGSTLSDRAAQFGFTGQALTAHPSQLLAIIIGRSGEGKSTFMYSHPSCLVLNIDLASVPLKTKATIWPGVHSDGSAIEPCSPGTPNSFKLDNGRTVRRISLTWELIRERVDQLIDLAENGQKPFEVVCFDTIDNAIDLLFQWVPKNAAKLGIARENKDSFRALDGRAAWEVLYNEVMDMGRRLRGAGYGVYYVMHLTNKNVNMPRPIEDSDSPDKSEETRVFLKDIPNVSANFWGRLFPKMEMIGVVTQESVVEIVSEHRRDASGKPLNDAQGKPIMTKPRSVTRQKHYLNCNPEDFPHVAKHRVRIPKLALPRGDAWEKFAAAYTAAAQGESE